MNRGFAAAAAVGLALVLSGCAGGDRSYASPDELHTAFVDAGAECDDPTEVPTPEALIGEGAHALLCMPGVRMLIVFDDASQLNSYIAETDGTSEIVHGERWVVIGEDVHTYADALGGTAT